MSSVSRRKSVAVIGGGPAGLMAAEVLAEAGLSVDVFDAMPSVGRKFLLAGVGGMNITHAEPFDVFVGRYGGREAEVGQWLSGFGPDALRQWIHGLGINTFEGSSGRVFPTDMKAAPLLRAWLHRLKAQGVRFHKRHRFTGWDAQGALRFRCAEGVVIYAADAVVMAMGGGSWSRLGSDGAWVPLLQARGVDIAPLRPANSGFDVAEWSDVFRERFAGAPLKSVVASVTTLAGENLSREGECVVTATGVEGSLVYALSSAIRDRIEAEGYADLMLDLMPGKSRDYLHAALIRPRGKNSFSNHLRKVTGLEGVKAGLLRECAPDAMASPEALTHAIKSLPVRLVACRPLDEAISSAGGIRFEGMTPSLMLNAIPGVFCAGEMLDWEAPTGGYLLTACFASGRVAAAGAAEWLKQH
jgi:uncharacterized flavoprotein (TIGR03862 family)